MSAEIVVIGGGGFIGSALCRRLVERGESVQVVCRRGDPGALPPGASLHRAGADDAARILPLLRRSRVVFYLACDTTPGSSANDPGAELNANIAPFVRFLQLIQDRKDLALVYFSSGGAIYGNPSPVPVRETASLAPLSYHGAAKAAIEALLHAHSHRMGAPVVVLRPSNVYGPGQSPREGFGLISTLLHRVRQGESVEIWGDGENVRDYLYIDDCIDACERVLNRLPVISGFHLYNLGSGVGHSTNQVCALVERVTGLSVVRRCCDRRVIDVCNIVLDSSAFDEAFGRSPPVALEEGIRRTWHWLREGGV
jgi:UDP-glucose 4-epimerase